MRWYRPKARVEAHQLQAGVIGRETLRNWLGADHKVKAEPGQWVIKGNNISVISDAAFQAQYEPC